VIDHRSLRPWRVQNKQLPPAPLFAASVNVNDKKNAVLMDREFIRELTAGCDWFFEIYGMPSIA
jgi:hypothetical protein